MGDGRPGRKPRRLYARIVRSLDRSMKAGPPTGAMRSFLQHLERVGRLVAHGPLTSPPGDLLLFRASELGEAKRVLRRDPMATEPSTQYEVVEWNPMALGAGVNLEIPSARGSGRLTRLQRVGVVVTDQERSIRFYRDGLGLEVRARDPATGYLELSLGRGTAALSLIAPRKEWGEPHFSEAVARIGVPTAIAFETDSIRALALRLKHLGARVTERPRAEPWGGRILRFSDPDGNEFLAFEATSPRRAK